VRATLAMPIASICTLVKVGFLDNRSIAVSGEPMLQLLSDSPEDQV
jgi:hypothetical protein